MYKKVCPEIFGEARKALEGLERFNLSEDVKDFISQYLNLSSDLNWLMVALAKAKTRQPDLLETVKDKYSEIQAQESIFDFSPIVTEHIPMYYMFCYTTTEATKQYLDRAIDSFDVDNQVYHPLGYLHYYSTVIRIGYDMLSFATRDADERVDLMIPLYTELLESDILPLALKEYEILTDFRLRAFKQVDTFSPTLDDLFESSMSVREFKDKMSSLATVNVLDGLNANAGSIEELLDLLSRATSGKMRKQGNVDVPKDIDSMFDDK